MTDCKQHSIRAVLDFWYFLKWDLVISVPFSNQKFQLEFCIGHPINSMSDMINNEVLGIFVCFVFEPPLNRFCCRPHCHFLCCIDSSAMPNYAEHDSGDCLRSAPQSRSLWCDHHVVSQPVSDIRLLDVFFSPSSYLCISLHTNAI